MNGGIKMTNAKIMQLGNFNITWGKNNLPMLYFFESIVFPCFTDGGFKRIDYSNSKEYFLSDVKLKEIDDEFVLVGNFIKSMHYHVNNIYENGELKKVPSDIPTAPYSRFIIFLKNHKMVMVKNENESPNIKSFQSTVNDILKKYIKKYDNKIIDNLSKSEIPILSGIKSTEDFIPLVNIIDIPYSDDIESIFKNVKKIDSVTLRFVPLNNDIPPENLFSDIDMLIKNNGSKSGNITINSPQHKENVIKTIKDSSAFAKPTIHVKDIDGARQTIKSDAFTLSKKIDIERDLTEKNDEKIAFFAKQDPKIEQCSPQNQKTYDEVNASLKKLIAMYIE